jgi:hypothetical protein
MNTYNTGTGTQPIQLMADISTLALAASRAILVDLNSGAQGVSVAQSKNATGDIPLTPIGLPSIISKKRLSIFTKIDIAGSDLPTRKREYEGITANYVLSQGIDGEKSFSNPEKTVDANFVNAMVIMHIDLL